VAFLSVDTRPNPHRSQSRLNRWTPPRLTIEIGLVGGVFQTEQGRYGLTHFRWVKTAHFRPF
jgi:hypothetical protein